MEDLTPETGRAIEHDAPICMCFATPRLLTWWIFGPALLWNLIELAKAFGGPNLTGLVPIAVFVPLLPPAARFIAAFLWAQTRTGRAYGTTANATTYVCCRDAYKAGCPPELYILTHQAVIYGRRALPRIPFLTHWFTPHVGPFPDRATAWTGVQDVLNVINHDLGGDVAAAWAGASLATPDNQEWVRCLTGVDESFLDRAGNPRGWAEHDLPIKLVHTGKPFSTVHIIWDVATRAGFTSPVRVTRWVTSGLWDEVVGNRYSPTDPQAVATIRAWANTGVPHGPLLRAARAGWEPDQVAAQWAAGTLSTTLDMDEALA